VLAWLPSMLLARPRGNAAQQRDAPPAAGERETRRHCGRCVLAWLPSMLLARLRRVRRPRDTERPPA